MLFKIIPFLAMCVVAAEASGQERARDSASASHVLADLVYKCRNVDFADPQVQQQGTFYKCAPLIVYRGDDEMRNWKDVANYSDPTEKKGVDEVCFRINETIGRDTAYHITGYATETESEGTWHILKITYARKGLPKNIIFAFLKIQGRFALGDIDNI